VLPLPGLPPVDSDGNVTLSVGLHARNLNLSPMGIVTSVLPLAAGEGVSLRLTAASGLFSGTYRPDAAGQTLTIEGVLLQKSGNGAGFGLNLQESAAVSLGIAP
jgi:hypothetical protein